MHCPHCGTEVNKADFCSNCGAKLEKNYFASNYNANPNQNQQNAYNANVSAAKQDTLGCLLGGCCVLVPILGIILWAVWRTERPQAAKTALIIFIVMMSLDVLGGIIGGIIAAAVVANGAYYAAGLAGLIGLL